MPADAGRLILSHVTPLPVEQVPLRLAAGRVLRQQVLGERDNPPFDRVCMDGVALSSAAVARGQRRFGIQATQAAGAVPLALTGDQVAIEAMTGAVMPHGTDCVIPVEEYDLASDGLVLHDDAAAAPWRNVQRRGSDSEPGALMLQSGVRLGAADIAIVASAGLAAVAVGRLPRISVISTGDELVEPGEAIADHQVRRSNAYGVLAALQLHGFHDTRDAHLRDDAALMQSRIGELLATHDVLVLSGGVSKGKFDFVPAALKALGVQQVFHQVAQRPGRPLWFGTGPQGQLVFGLPGNPVSTLVCLHRYVLPALRAALGQQPAPVERLQMSEPLEGRSLTYFMPVVLDHGAATPGTARARPPHGSGDFLALAGTHGFVELPPLPSYPAGFIADFHRWQGW